MSTSVQSSPSYRMAEFVSDHAHKLIVPSIGFYLAPSVGGLAALTVAVVTRGRVVKPWQWYNRPNVVNNMKRLMIVSVVTAAGSGAAGPLAQNMCDHMVAEAQRMKQGD